MASMHDQPDPFGIEEPSREILEAQVGRVHSRFEALDRSFRRLLYAFFLLALTLFSLLFYPYVSVHGERARLLDERDAVTRAVAALEEAIAQGQEALAVLTAHRGRAVVNRQRTVAFEFHETLWASARQHEEELFEAKERFVERGLAGAESWTVGDDPGAALVAELSMIREFARFARPTNPCQWLVEESWVRCEIGRELRAVHDAFLVALRQSAAAGSLGVTAEMEGLHDRISGREHPEDRGDRLSALRLEVSRYWQDYLSALNAAIDVQDERRRAAHADRDQGAADLERLNAAVASADAQLADLQQFNDIDTPIGTLPVGLDQVILLFPVLLGAGSYLLAAMFCETIRTRELLRGLYASKTGTVSVTARQAALIAPLWLDPADPVQGRSGRYVLVAAAPVLIVGAVATLLANGFMAGGFLQRPTGVRVAYLVLYVCSLALSIAGVFQIVRAFRQVRDAPTADARVHGPRAADPAARMDQ